MELFEETISMVPTIRIDRSGFLVTCAPVIGSEIYHLFVLVNLAFYLEQRGFASLHLRCSENMHLKPYLI